jgi:hypothetical protein
MLKHFLLFIFLFLALISSSLASSRHYLKKKRRSHSRMIRMPRVTKHFRKSRHYHHGNGPNLKSITTDSTYKEDPNNGINPIETKQPLQ